MRRGIFFVKIKVRNKSDAFQWLLAVYGPAQTKPKQAFLAELAHLCLKETLPMIIGDDFNIIRGPVEKNNNHYYDDRWPFLFNAVIDACNLRELELSGRCFTWANHRTAR